MKALILVKDEKLGREALVYWKEGYFVLELKSLLYSGSLQLSQADAERVAAFIKEGPGDSKPPGGT